MMKQNQPHTKFTPNNAMQDARGHRLRLLTILFLSATLPTYGCTKNTHVCENRSVETELDRAIYLYNLGDTSLAHSLLADGMHPGETNPCGASLLTVAAIKGDVEFVSELLNGGADPNQVNWKGETPLMLAANWAENEVVKILLESGGNPNLKTSNASLYDTALMLAVINNHIETTEILVKAGAEVEYVNSKGKSAVSEAKLRGYKEVLAVLESAL